MKVPIKEPIAKYSDEKGRVFFVTDYQVTALLRKAARETLNIKAKTTLSKWSSHSLRVTAANELHRLNYSESFIKKRLRWKSDAFLVYLRNTIHIARMHTIGLARNTIRITDDEKKILPSIYRTKSRNDILWGLNLAQ